MLQIDGKEGRSQETPIALGSIEIEIDYTVAEYVLITLGITPECMKP